MATFTSISSGAWDTDGQVVWDIAGHPSASGDIVIIASGHAITAAVGAINIGTGTITIQGPATMNVVTTGGANRYDFQHKTIQWDSTGDGTLSLGSGIKHNKKICARKRAVKPVKKPPAKQHLLSSPRLC